MIKNKIQYLVVILFSVSFLNAQIPDGYLREFYTLPSLDTLKVERYYGDWWFGVFGGPNINLFFGDLYSKINPLIKDTLYNPKISFNSAFGGGFYFGAMAEYKPRNERLAYSLGISLLDRKAFSTETNQMNDSLKTRYEYKSVLDYIIISPQVKYFSDVSGLYYYGGLDVGFNIGATAKQAKRYINSGIIDEFVRVPGIKPNVRLEFNLGVGYEFLLADYAGKSRFIGSPYIAINGGTKALSQLNSSWKTLGFKVGFAIKFGKDYREFDTLRFDETYVEPPQFLAQVSVSGVEFTGFRSTEPLVSAWLAMVELPEIVEEVAEVTTPVFQEELRQREITGQVRRRIIPNQMVVFNFDKPETTNLSPQIIEYLDLLADYLRANPNFEIRITVHSDNQGTLQQNTQRATARANNVRNYLVNQKGIPANRVLATSRGALIPVAPNDTPANQRKNRRVEIIVVPR